ncbi:MAG: NAD-dependent protein deacylase [Bacilli bacterium]|nr:NAD-dependent protein deacylase [Bacilli bacterium]
MDEKLILEAKKHFKADTRIVFLGGAGVSTASGIPDFRSPQGIYKAQKKYHVSYEALLSHSFFLEEPETFYDFYWSSMVYPEAKPNKAHKALAEYEKKGHRVVIMTQNIDGLHQDAGSKIVYELHGSVRRYECMGCGERFTLDDIPHEGVPTCPSCGGQIKPDVVLYEEPLDGALLQQAAYDMMFTDILIVGGTSLNVYPAAGLIDYYRGPCKILINKSPTPRDDEFDYVFHEDIGDLLEILLK